MDIFQLSQTCRTYECCTDCPIRKGCAIRERFYDEQFSQHLLESVAIANSVCMSFGLSDMEIMTVQSMYLHQMNQKQKNELELHPTYSIE